MPHFIAIFEIFMRPDNHLPKDLLWQSDTPLFATMPPQTPNIHPALSDTTPNIHFALSDTTPICLIFKQSRCAAPTPGPGRSTPCAGQISTLPCRILQRIMMMSEANYPRIIRTLNVTKDLTKGLFWSIIDLSWEWLVSSQQALSSASATLFTTPSNTGPQFKLTPIIHG